MKDFSLIRVAAAVPEVKVADVEFNLGSISSLINAALAEKASLVAFPELCITGYTCADLFGQDALLSAAESSVARICALTKDRDVTVVVGTPVPFQGRLYNCAAVISNGHLRGLVPKIWLPTYGEFYEGRWFASGSDFLCGSAPGIDIYYAGDNVRLSPNQLFEVGKATVGIEICEDLWTPIPPSSHQAMAGADILVNLSASNEVLMKESYRRQLVGQQSARTISAYIYTSAGWGESTQDLVYAGAALICENGTIMAENKRFQKESSIIYSDVDLEKLSVLRQKMSTFGSFSPDGTAETKYRPLYQRIKAGKTAATDFEAKLYRFVDPHPFVPSGSTESDKERDARCNEIISLQVSGLAKRLSHINCKTAVIGVSGGLDSTLALLVTALAFDYLGWKRSRIIGITMPGFGTTKRTHSNADDLMKGLGVTLREISIAPSVKQHFKDIGHDPDVHDVTYENCQARERTQILMDVANQESGIVVGTGDLSELALGWATYNGDHMSMYAVNAGVPKTLVRHLVKWAAQNKFPSAKEILLDIVDTPVSPELLPVDSKGRTNQITEDVIGPYELHDFFLYNFFRFGYAPDKILFLAKKAFPEIEPEVIVKWLRTFIKRFFGQQFKRSCLPDCPKVGSVTLSPRGDWRMPSDASASIFLSLLD
jgi:NAD+ synthase (glutamine-hydrolysing)